MTDVAIKAKHRQRGLNAMAEHVCATDYTDGFCSPDTNGLMSGVARCRHHNLPRNGRDCVARALGLVQAMESRGCSIVWDHDPAVREEQNVAPLIASELPTDPNYDRTLSALRDALNDE